MRSSGDSGPLSPSPWNVHGLLSAHPPSRHQSSGKVMAWQRHVLSPILALKDSESPQRCPQGHMQLDSLAGHVRTSTMRPPPATPDSIPTTPDPHLCVCAHLVLSAQVNYLPPPKELKEPPSVPSPLWAIPGFFRENQSLLHKTPLGGNLWPLQVLLFLIFICPAISEILKYLWNGWVNDFFSFVLTFHKHLSAYCPLKSRECSRE